MKKTVLNSTWAILAFLAIFGFPPDFFLSIWCRRTQPLSSSASLRTDRDVNTCGENIQLRLNKSEGRRDWGNKDRCKERRRMCERLSFSSLWYLIPVCWCRVNINRCWRMKRRWRVNDRMNKHWWALKRRIWRARPTWETRSGWTVCSLRRWSNDRCPAAPNPSCHWTRRSGSCKHTRTHRRLSKPCFT